jgi:hypothetical protein
VFLFASAASKNELSNEGGAFFFLGVSRGPKEHDDADDADDEEILDAGESRVRDMLLPVRSSREEEESSPSSPPKACIIESSTGTGCGN